MSSLTEAPAAAPIPDETLQADSQALVQGRSKHFNWILAIWLAVFHAGAIVAFFFFTWSALAVAAAHSPIASGRICSR